MREGKQEGRESYLDDQDHVGSFSLSSQSVAASLELSYPDLSDNQLSVAGHITQYKIHAIHNTTVYNVYICIYTW